MSRTTRVLFVFTFVTLVGACGSNSNPVSRETGIAVSSNVVSNSSSSALASLVAGIPQVLPVSNVFENNGINEASGIQRSQALSGAYYVHNDSGASATLYVTDAIGQSLGQLQVSGVQATDWEAIAGVQLNGLPHLVIADIGDNDRIRRDLKLQVIEEPDFSALTVDFDLSVSARTVDVSYADGLSYDAEALFISGDNDSVIVVTKNITDTSSQSIWQGSLASGLNAGTLVLEYRGLLAVPAGLLVNAVTDSDIHPDGRQLALLVYGPTLGGEGRVFVWQAATGEGTFDALTRSADRVIDIPANGSNRQAEGISFNNRGDVLLVAAEGAATSTITVVSY